MATNLTPRQICIFTSSFTFPTTLAQEHHMESMRNGTSIQVKGHQVRYATCNPQRLN